jgi:CRISPR/Cas system CSM-associated protein Csm3 (group 7 of RAMP superfamily)
MLEQYHIRFDIKLLADTHVGNGEMQDLRELRLHMVSNGGETMPVRCIQRGADELPVIEGSSLRGAFRRMAGDAEVKLFGPEQVSDMGDGTTGALWVYAATWKSVDETACNLLPHWCADSKSFILAGSRMDRETGAHEHGLLYSVEYLPLGTTLGCQMVLEGSGEAKLLKTFCLPLLRSLAAEEGFGLGAERGYGNGRARLLPDTLKIERHRYDAAKKDFVTELSNEKIKPANRSQTLLSRSLDMQCTGPFFISETTRKGQNGDDADFLPLARAADQPILTGKAVLQELRRRTAWCEVQNWLNDATNGYKYDDAPIDDPDRVLGVGQSAAGLSATQRVFGVTGWGKVLRIKSVSLTPSGQSYHAQGIQLDVFTQSPMDGALLTYSVPADLKAQVEFEFDNSRYRDELQALLSSDLGLLDQALATMTLKGAQPGYGHGTTSGFGAFGNCVIGFGGDIPNE